MSERRKMAQWWADHLDMLRGGVGSTVITLTSVRSKG